MAALGISPSTQRFLLVEAGVQDIEHLDEAYKSLTPEQAASVIEGARKRAAA
jgi:hypothetical protein